VSTDLKTSVKSAVSPPAETGIVVESATNPSAPASGEIRVKRFFSASFSGSLLNSAARFLIRP